MMVSRHNEAVKALYELCKKLPSYSEVFADSIGVDYRPIDIVAPHAKGVRPVVYPYHPDVWARLKRTNRIDAIEVWDSQSASDSVEDLVLSALTPNIETLSIVCFDSETSELAKELTSTILSSIHTSKGRRLLNPSDVMQYIVLVPEGFTGNELRNFLGKSLYLTEGTRSTKAGSYVKGKSCGRGNHNYVRQGTYMKCTKCKSTRHR